jgi:hypothetical protein
MALSLGLLVPLGRENTLAAGLTLQVNSTVQGALTQGHPSDLYRLTVPSDGSLTVAARGDGTLGTPYVQLLDAGRGRISGVSSGVAGNPRLGPGTYYVRVSDGNSGAYSLTATFTTPNGPNDAHAGSSTSLRSAMPMPVNGTVQGHLGYSVGWHAGVATYNASDLYRLVVSSDGSLNVTGGGDGTLGTPSLQLWDARGGNITAVSMGTVGSSRLDPGTYYLEVSDANYGAYTLSATFTSPTGTNDAHTGSSTSMQSAMPLAVNGTVQGHLGYSAGWLNGVATYNTSDLYNLAVPSDGSLTVTARGDGTLGTPYVQLRDASSSHIAGPSAGTVANPRLGPGTYYVEVSDGNYGAYTLTATFTSPSGPNDAHTGNSTMLDSAMPLAVNGTVQGHLGYIAGWLNGVATYNTSDLYRIAVPSTGLLTIAAHGDSTLGTPNVQLWDANSRHITTVSTTGSVNSSRLPAGTYYVYLATGNKYGSYTLTSTFTPKS